MTINELLAVAPNLVELNITIRDHGKYVYRYAIAQFIKVYQCYPYERQFVTEGEHWDLTERGRGGGFPATFWAVDPRQAKEIQDLEIERVEFSKPSYSWLYKDRGGWESRAVVTCYPRGWVKPLEVSPQVSTLKGQMSLEDYEVEDE